MDTVLTILLVLNTHWITLAARVAELEQSFQPLRIEITTHQTNFQNIPFVDYSESGQTRIDDNWLDSTIVPLASSSDLVAFVTPRHQWKAPNASGYQHTDRPLITAEASEDWTFKEIMSHEIAHALYALTPDKPDRTHELIAKHGYRHWLPHFLKSYEPPNRINQLRETILGLGDFLIERYPPLVSG